MAHLHKGPDGSFYLTGEPPEATWQFLAAQYSAILKTDVQVLDRDTPDAAGYRGLRVKTAGGYHADVYMMLVSWRLALVPAGEEQPVPERFWCFEGLDGVSLALAVGNAALWDGSDDWAPTGFSRPWDRAD